MSIGLENIEPADGGEEWADVDVGAPRGGRPLASPVTRIKTVLLLRLKYLAPSTAHNHQLLLISRLNVRCGWGVAVGLRTLSLLMRGEWFEP